MHGRVAEGHKRAVGQAVPEDACQLEACRGGRVADNDDTGTTAGGKRLPRSVDRLSTYILGGDPLRAEVTAPRLIPSDIYRDPSEPSGGGGGSGERWLIRGAADQGGG